jgi:hypothetical protein
MIQTNNYHSLIEKLDQFIRKFYLNQLIKGALYFTGLTLFLFLAFNMLEYFFNFGTTGRKMMFFSFVGVAALGLLSWIIEPIVHYFRLGKTINHEDASKIIGSHFVDVEDKLLNILHLKKQEESSSNKDLLMASIAQKTDAIKLVPFKSAIDLTKNKKYLRFALPPFLMLVAVLFAAPSIIKDSTYRILNNDKEFAKPAPFSFALKEGKLEVPQFEDYNLDIKVEGTALPNEVFVEIDGFQYKAEKIDNQNFTYLFRNVQKDTKFNIVSGNIRSVSETLEVIKKPNLNDFKVVLNYPLYTGRQKEVLDNVGDMIVPEGTVVTWNFNADNTDLLQLKFDGERPLSASQSGANLYGFKKSIRKDHFYQVLLSNSRLTKPDSLNYSINVVKDQHPVVSVETFMDSTDRSKIYFAGNASDDYGISNLSFHYTLIKMKGGAQPEKILKVEKAEGRDIGFEYSIDIKNLGVEPGDNVTYYFQVADNDAINGAKTAKTGSLSFNKPSIDELKEKENLNEETIKDNLKENIEELEKLQEKFRKMREKLLQEKQLDWQAKKELEKLMKDQEEVQKKIEENKKLLQENMKNQEEMEKTPDPEIQEKQERIQELMNESVNQEQQEMMEKIQELMQELEKEDALEMMQQFEMNNENKNKDMKRLLELYKQLEMEKEVQDQLKDINELAKKQEDLAKKTDEVAKKEDQKQDQTKEKEDIAKKQEELEKKMEELMKKQEELEKKNKELSPPKKLGEDNKEKMDDAKQDMKESKKEMSSKSGDSKKASKKQKDASKKMQKMAEEMGAAMDGEEKEQNAEDIKTIRQLLENLVTVSFDQERLSKEIVSTPTTTPKYVDLVKQQFKLKNDFTVIEDSLTALSQRVDKIESFVTEKVTEIKYNINSSIEKLEDRQTGVAVEGQRRTMKNLNDLANMLSESMKNMQQQMSGNMPGSQSCEKPGGKGGKGNGGKVPLDKISDGQQGVDEAMKGMSDKMGKGQKPSAKDFAEAAAKQAALRKALEENAKDKKEQGKGGGNQALEEIINQMDKLEVELVNKRLNAESMKRQKDILTKLLEAEKAERQREMDEKRKSESAAEVKKPMPPALQDYLKKRQSEAELFKTTSPALRAHYKNLVDEYYKALKSK